MHGQDFVCGGRAWPCYYSRGIGRVEQMMYALWEVKQMWSETWASKLTGRIGPGTDFVGLDGGLSHDPIFFPGPDRAFGVAATWLGFCV